MDPDDVDRPTPTWMYRPEFTEQLIREADMYRTQIEQLTESVEREKTLGRERINHSLAELEIVKVFRGLRPEQIKDLTMRAAVHRFENERAEARKNNGERDH